MIIINFKNYKTGKAAFKLAKKIRKFIPKAIIAVPCTDIGYLAYNTLLTVYAQHIDHIESEKTTGLLHPKTIKAHGGKGSLLNHSEHKIPLKDIKESLRIAEKFSLKIALCASSISELKQLIKLKPNPYAIAFEDPKLISTGKSITKYNPKAIIKFIQIMKKTKIIPLCGAGISTAEDVKQAYSLGCKGILIASAIANSKNPIPLLKKLRELK